MYVTKIRRLNTGCRLHDIAYRNEGDYFMITTDLTIDYQIDSNTKVEIITEDEFYSNLSDFYQDMKYIILIMHFIVSKKFSTIKKNFKII